MLRRLAQYSPRYIQQHCPECALSTPSLIPDDNYSAFLKDLKSQIRRAQVKAALAVNQEVIVLYWHIGQAILDRQSQEGWGTKVIQRLAKDLKREFPEMKGFSRTNLLYMRAFAAAWPELAIVQRVAGQIPWRHNQLLLDKLKDTSEREWYATKTLHHGWSRDVLAMQIDSELYRRQGGAINNFEQTLPKAQSDLARQLIKDPYHFEFLDIDGEVGERELEKALVEHIKDFLLELGVGFAFLGSQYHLEVAGDDYYLDLLFYHIQLRCFVVIDLKVTEFKPEYSGKMNFYISAVDDLLRTPNDQPTIGIVLCRSKKRVVAEYALRNVSTPIAVSTHQLPSKLQESLPSTEQLEIELETAMQEIEAPAPKESTTEIQEE
jgi:predicted nuclease of restriction endonuclease-like (RecB) superfamily